MIKYYYYTLNYNSFIRWRKTNCLIENIRQKYTNNTEACTFKDPPEDEHVCHLNQYYIGLDRILKFYTVKICYREFFKSTHVYSFKSDFPHSEIMFHQ